jgi:CubicO group peptidase (beta-lactamase class C family)
MTDLVERDPELLALVEELAAEHAVPGLSAGVLVDGRTLVATAGVTSVKDPLPVDEDTLFMIGSTSKTFTATALMALVDQGRVSLEDRVVDHLPDLVLADEQVSKSVTVRQLVNHTSGWRGDLTPNTGWGDDALARALEVLRSAPQELAPGTVASYSNSGFTLAGHLVATVHGTSYEQAVRELVLTPLGLSRSVFFPWEVANVRHAVAHVVADGTATAVEPYPAERALGPCGGLLSSLRDQLSWARYHLDGSTSGTPPLAEPTRLLMQQPTVAARSAIDGIGLSWLLSHHDEVRLVSHGGNVSNLQTSTFALAPDHGLAVTVMTNSGKGAAVGDRVLGWALSRFLGVGPRRQLPTVPFDASELVGFYDLGPFGNRLTAVDGRLYLQLVVPESTPEELKKAFANPPRELVAVGRDVFAAAADPTIPVLDVHRDEHGAVAGVVTGMRFARRS